MRRTLVAVVIGLWVGSTAHAAPLPGFIKDNVGSWLIVPDNGKVGCRIELRGVSTPGGWLVEPAPDCAMHLPIVAQSRAWGFDGGVRLLGPDRKILLDFQEDETTLMKTSFENKPVFYIVKAPPGVDRAPFAPALVGQWNLRRPGGAILCSLQLSQGAKDDETELTVKTGAPCDSAVSRLKLRSARVEDVSLMLYGEKDTSLRLQATGTDSYIKAEGGKPLEMVRAQ